MLRTKKNLRDLLIKDPKKPIVAVIAPGSLPIPPVLGGAIQTVAYENVLTNNKHNVVIISRLEPGLAKFELGQDGIGHIRIRNNSYDKIELLWQKEFIFRYSRYIHKTCKILKEIKPDLVHVYSRPLYVPLLRKALGPKVKIILTNQNLRISEDKYVLKRVEKIIADLDEAVYPSWNIAKLDLLNAFPQYKAKVSVIYNGVDAKLFKRSAAADIEAAKKRYALTDKRVLLYAGRLVREKGIDKILEAMPEVLKEIPEARLVIVGSSFFGKGKNTPYIKKLKQLAEPIKDKVIFTGFIHGSKLPIYFSMSDIFVSPVVWDDPSPVTMYESSACEVPIIATKRGGIPEIVEDGKSAILLATPYEISTLAQAIVKLLKDKELAGKIAATAKKRVLERFSRAKLADQWTALYQKWIEKGD